MIDPDGPTPVYVQIADAIAKHIARGDLAPNRPIPSETQLQQEYGVARATARHAVAELRSRGLVYTVPQRGTYVSELPKK
jgi:DNA-binding GntR family transcriptional regulator